MQLTSRAAHLGGRAAIALIAINVASAHAATVSYGGFGPVAPGILFTDVSEDFNAEPVPQYGPPESYSAGLDFDPHNFNASAAGGTADVTDGQLKFTIKSTAKIDAIVFFGAGEYSLGGLATPAPAVTAGASMRVTVKQINFVDITPFDIVTTIPPIGLSNPPNQVAQPWSFAALMDVTANLDPLFSGPNVGATSVDVVIDSRLTASSAPGAAAFIALNEFQVDVVSIELVPEPSQLTLLGIAICGLLGTPGSPNLGGAAARGRFV